MGQKLSKLAWRHSWMFNYHSSRKKFKIDEKLFTSIETNNTSRWWIFFYWKIFYRRRLGVNVQFSTCLLCSTIKLIFQFETKTGSSVYVLYKGKQRISLLAYCIIFFLNRFICFQNPIKVRIISTKIVKKTGKVWLLHC